MMDVNFVYEMTPSAKTLFFLDAVGMAILLSISTKNLIVIQSFITIGGALIVLSPFLFYYWWSWKRARYNATL